jgi:hypothetical protein
MERDRVASRDLDSAFDCIWQALLQTQNEDAHHSRRYESFLMMAEGRAVNLETRCAGS